MTGFEPTRAPWADAQATRAPWAAETPLPASEQPSQAGSTRDSDENAPKKRINSQQDLQIFTQSKLCNMLMDFAAELSDAVQGIPISGDRINTASPIVRSFAQMLEEFEAWVGDFPPLVQPMRFGNKAFRQWHERLDARAEESLRAVLGATPETANKAPELAKEFAHYLRAAFGDPRRIDYGTGHEASFFALLFGLASQGMLEKTDSADLVLIVFQRYMRVMRRLQTVYVLEPAGSHGVWGLDDFHHLPFLFGASQLKGQEEHVATSAITQEGVLQNYADKYLYIDAIQQILLAKTGAPFHETSPMLYDITAVATWDRIHKGLVKMYRAEVFGKYPVIQHFLFGKTLQWPGDDVAQLTE